MPITRFKTLDDAARALRRKPGAPELLDDWNRLHELSLPAPEAPPRRGVFRYESIEEANRDTEAWIQRRLDAGARRKLDPHRDVDAKRTLDPQQEEGEPTGTRDR